VNWECLLLILQEMVTMEIHAKIVGLLQKERLLLLRKKKNPLVKLLMDTSSSQDSLLEDYFLLTTELISIGVPTIVYVNEGPEKKRHV
jgi:hypothetical protein